MRVSVRSRFAIGLLIAALAMSTFSLSTADSAVAQGKKRYIVLGANEQLPSGFESVVAAAGGRVIGTVPEVGIAIVESGEPSFEAAASGIAGIEAVTEDEEVFLGGPVDGTVSEGESAAEGIAVEGHSPQAARFFPVQWALQTINADEAWTEGFKGDPSVDVAVLDTGVDYTHQDLAGKVDMERSKSFYDEALSPLPPSLMLPVGFIPKPFADFNGHGTHVAAVIAGQGIGVAGVAPHVRLIAVKVGGRDGFAQWSAILLAIRYAADIGADVINMSFGAQMTREELRADHLKRALKRAVKYAERRGAFLTASAGNSAVDWDQEKKLTKIPAELPGVNAVSATGPVNFMDFDLFAPYSDGGRSIIDFAAPGGNVTPFRCVPILPRVGQMTACIPVPPGHPLYSVAMPADAVLSACSRFVEYLPGNARRFPCNPTMPPFTNSRSNVFNAGTSMSAAIVSGTAALVDSVAGGALTGEQIRRILRGTAVDLGRRGRDAQFGNGRVDALSAARCATKYAATDQGRRRSRNDCDSRQGDGDDD